MTAQTKTLTEGLKFIEGTKGRNNTDISTKAKVVIYYGTYQQVINQLDAEGVPEHKVKGFAYTSTGNCEVLVHKQ